jgi:serine/threonine protein kinase
VCLQVLKCPYKSKPEENKEKVHLHYSNTVDSWAVGVLVYELLVGCPPFYDKSKSTTEARIVSGVPHFPPTMSEAAKNFICAGEWLDFEASLAGCCLYMLPAIVQVQAAATCANLHQTHHLPLFLLALRNSFLLASCICAHH